MKERGIAVRKFLIPIFILSLLLVFTFSINGTDSPDEGNQVIYYIPHQDDEVITFGVSIYSNIQRGSDVHVVLLTNGANSNIREILGISKEEFSTARNKEFDKALAVLGVKSENIVKKGFTDGELTQSQVESVIRDYADMYPHASHKTASYQDPYSDHANAGKALKKLSEQEIISDATYYFGPNYTPVNVEINQDPYDPSYYPFIKAASRSYKVENEALGMYGIGWKSVPGLFESIEENPVSQYHL